MNNVEPKWAEDPAKYTAPSTPRAEPTSEKDENTKSNVIFANAVSYCNVTTIHGFFYCVSAENIVEKLFWVLTVVIGFTCSSLIISSAIQGWLDEPGVTVINTFSKVPTIDFHFTIMLSCRS